MDGMSLYRGYFGINNVDPLGCLSELPDILWPIAKDTAFDHAPFKPDLPDTGDVFDVPTIKGTIIKAWKPHDGKTFWCHGYTFGGHLAENGPFSIYGQQVPIVLNDGGWKKVCCGAAGKDDIVVFSNARDGITHSGRAESIKTESKEGYFWIDEAASNLSSKWGPTGKIRTDSFELNADTYRSQYACYTKEDVGPVPCCLPGTRELP